MGGQGKFVTFSVHRGVLAELTGLYSSEYSSLYTAVDGSRRNAKSSRRKKLYEHLLNTLNARSRLVIPPVTARTLHFTIQYFTSLFCWLYYAHPSMSVSASEYLQAWSRRV